MDCQAVAYCSDACKRAVAGAHARACKVIAAAHFAHERGFAEKGNVIAMSNVGTAYEFGHGVEQSDAEAATWYRRAADKGNAGARLSLAIFYRKGRGGLPVDHAELVRYLRLAAAQGDADAECELGIAFAKGEGVARDFVEAVRWWRKVATQNYADAMDFLCIAYCLGRGVERSFAEARAWLGRAKDAGYDATKLAERAGHLNAAAASAASAAGDSAALIAALRIGADAEDGALTRVLGLALLRGTLCPRDLPAARAHLERACALGGVTPAERAADLAELSTAEAEAAASSSPAAQACGRCGAAAELTCSRCL
jgi:hypothetical protein